MLHNLRIHQKFAAIFLLPLVVLTALAVGRIRSNVTQSVRAGRVNTLVTFTVTLAGLAHELQKERDLSAVFVSDRRSGRTAERAGSLRPRAPGEGVVCASEHLVDGAGGVKVAYQAVGSGKGVKRFMGHQVDFGASDLAMTDDELAAAEEDGGPVLHVPTVIGAVAVAYSLPGDLPHLRMDAQLAADLFTGKVRRWNDRAVAARNPGVALPNLPVTVVHRSDSSGTTANFTSFVAAHSPEFKSRVGTGKSVKWPVGVAAQGSGGVAKAIKATPGAVGYVELTYALDQHLGYAAVESSTGRFVTPSPETMGAAAQGLELVSVINNFRVSLIDATGADAYPITSWTFILVRESQPDAVKARTVANLLWYDPPGSGLGDLAALRAPPQVRDRPDRSQDPADLRARPERAHCRALTWTAPAAGLTFGPAGALAR